MKKSPGLSLLAIGLLLSVVSYAQSGNPLYRHLPPNADHVTEINYSQISGKGNLGAILNAIPSVGDPSADFLLSILRDPAAAGIDLSHNVVIAQTTAGGKGADTLNFSYIICQLSDSAKFRTGLAKSIHYLHFHRIPGKGTTTSAAVAKMGLAWNDQVVVATIGSPDPLKTGGKSGSVESHRPIAELAATKSQTALAGFTVSPWLTDQRFLTGFATTEDFHFWSTGTNVGSLFSKLAAKFGKKNGLTSPMARPPAYAANMPKTPILSTGNFGNGKIEFHMTTFSSPENAAAMKEFLDRPFNKDLLARVPDGLLLGCIAIHFNTAAVESLLDKYHTRHMIDSLLAKKGLTIGDITAPLGGDILLTAIATDSIGGDSAKKNVKVYFVASIADQARLLALAAKIGANANASGDTTKHHMIGDLGKKMVLKDNILVISNSIDDAGKYFSNQNRRSTDLLGDNKAMMQLVIDLKAVSSLMGSSMSSNPKMMIAARLLSRLDKVIVTNGILEGDNMTTDLQITTGDPNTNSLATLLGILH
jgi:hypothetical protein